MTSKNVFILSLGCPKNTVDSTSMGALLERGGYTLCHDADHADVILVNTCGFIDPAKAESLEVLQNLAAGKQSGQLLIAAGCLTQRYGAAIASRVPGVDAIMGTRRWMDVLDVVEKARRIGGNKTLVHLPGMQGLSAEEQGVMRASLHGGSAFLEIADGCRRSCAFCAIPLIKGTTVSRPMEAVLADAERLQELGAREIILIAQDTSSYGVDRGESDSLAELLEQMVRRAPDVDWIRVLYAYPGAITGRLIDLMQSETQILPYLDIPLQHADVDVLRSMNRPSNMEGVRRTIDEMRKRMPDLALRTTFIVGFPTETEKAFQNLLQFVEDVEFDRLGVFTYSPEEGTPAEPLGDPIPDEIKEARRERIMETQQALSLAINQRLIGQKLDVLIDGVGEGVSIGRTYRDAPEIDGMVLIEEELEIGEIYPVRFSDALPYDLIGERII